MKQEKNITHIDGELHVTGKTKYLLESPLPQGSLIMQPVYSTYASADILEINYDEALSVPGVVRVLTHKDIPGINQIGVIEFDEPLLPENKVSYIGQPVAIIVCTNKESCTNALSKIKIKYNPYTPILTIEDAETKNSFFDYKQEVKRGNPDKAFDKCDYIIEDEITGGAQDHLYLETQRVLVVPDEGNHYFIYSATQSPTEIQSVVSRILGIKSKDITVDVKRLGGAFGGKERKATIFASLAALASYHTGKPVYFIMSRQDDMKFTGKRHPFKTRYKVGFDKNGKILAAKFQLTTNGGAFTDLSTAVLERFVLNMDGSYFIPDIEIKARIAKTNLPPNTAFRGFGAPQAFFSIEHIIERIAFKLKKDPIEIRIINAYKEGQPAPYGQKIKETYIVESLEKLKRNSNYTGLKKEIENFNRTHKFEKKGIGVVSLKFGISFTSKFLNQGSALVWIYTDGTVSVSHGAVEMGQEVNTKIAQIVANELGIDISKVRIESTNTKRVANTSPTAASTAVDLNGNAALKATQKIKQRLISHATKLFNDNCNKNDVYFQNNKIFCKHSGKSITFEELVSSAYLNRINLGAQEFYRTPGIGFDREKGKGNPFYYYVYGAALSVVKVDLLTGMYKVEKTYIIHEDGNPVNSHIDIGQIQGAYIQGMGWVTMEEIIYDNNGNNLASNTSVYKIPAYSDTPEVFEIELVKKNRKFASVLGSKGVGEPPFIYGLSVIYALQNAIESISNYKKEAILHLPATPEKVLWEITKQQ